MITYNYSATKKHVNKKNHYIIFMKRNIMWTEKNIWKSAESITYNYSEAESIT